MMNKNRFKLLELIAKGGFGEVYKGVDQINGDGRCVAIKKLYKKTGNNDNSSKIKNEILIHSKLKHENVVKFEGYYEDEKAIYIVMEYCEKGSLYKELEKNCYPFEEDLVKEYLIQIINGIGYIHSMGYVHRDIKLSNIYLTNNGVIKIGDFGLSLPISTPITGLVGTPEYLDIDILNKKITAYVPQIDVWALGCVVYSLLTRNSPFKSSTIPEIYERIKYLDYDLPGTLSYPAIEFIIHTLCSTSNYRWSIKQCYQSQFLQSIIEVENNSICSDFASTNRSITSNHSSVYSVGSFNSMDNSSTFNNSNKMSKNKAKSTESSIILKKSNKQINNIIPELAIKPLSQAKYHSYLFHDIKNIKRKCLYGSLEIIDESMVYVDTIKQLKIYILSNGYQSIISTKSANLPCTLNRIPAQYNTLFNYINVVYHCTLSTQPKVVLYNKDTDAIIGMLMMNNRYFKYQSNGYHLIFYNGYVNIKYNKYSYYYKLPGYTSAVHKSLCNDESCYCDIGNNSNGNKDSVVQQLPANNDILKLVLDGIKYMRKCLDHEREAIRVKKHFPIQVAI